MSVQMLENSSTAHGNAIPHGHYTKCDSVVTVKPVIQFPQRDNLLVQILQSDLCAEGLFLESFDINHRAFQLKVKGL